MSVKQDKIKLIVGLGNPGSQYISTPHNAGFLLLDHLLDELRISANWKSKGHAEFTKIHYKDEEYFLLKPQNYMNNSGPVVQGFAAYYKIKPEETLIIHDEVDLPLGTCKLKYSGGAGGHNGLRSLFGAWGKDFWRFRVGVGKDPRKDTADHVLSRWPSNKIVEFIDPGLKKLQLILDKGVRLAINEVNRD